MAVGLNLDNLLIEHSRIYKKHYILFISKGLYHDQEMPDSGMIDAFIDAAKSCITDKDAIDTQALQISWRDNGFIAISMYSAADMNTFQDKIQDQLNYAVYNDGHVVMANRLDT